MRILSVFENEVNDIYKNNYWLKNSSTKQVIDNLQLSIHDFAGFNYVRNSCLRCKC